MRDARNPSARSVPLVLLAATVVVAALFAPWYAIDFSGATRDAIVQNSGRLPGVLGEFARGLLSVLPDRIVANGWEVFEKTDIVLLCCALGAGFAALLGRLDVAALAGGGAAATTVLAMLDKPGPGEIVSLQWGAWVALGGALAIVAAARFGAGEDHAAAPEAQAPAGPATPVTDRPVATVWPPVET